MRLLVTVQHPAHVHFYRPVIAGLAERGHDVRVLVREKDLVVDLLDAYGVDHEVLAGPADSPPGLPAGSALGVAAVQARWEYRLQRAARRLRPDVVTGVGGLAAAHVGALTGARSVVFTDTETPANYLAAPVADLVCTPEAFGQSFRGQLRYPGFQELSYLHPDRFEPDPAVLRAGGVEPGEPYGVCRFSAMTAHHDVGAAGLSPGAKRDVVARIRAAGPAYVSVEDGGPPPDEAEVLPVEPHRLHHLLAHADVVVTDAATTATEAGLLGTPTVRVAADDLGNFRLLESYGLVRSTPDEAEALGLVDDVLADPSAGEEWQRRRGRLLDETVDVAAVAAGALAAAGRGGDLPADAADPPEVPANG